MPDNDQSGTTFQQARVYLGPTLGWVVQQVRPAQNITAGGTTTILSGTSVVLVNVAATVTLNLPSIRQWVLETFYQPVTGFERAIWIKDLGGHATLSNITVHPFGTDTIDGAAADQVINTNFQLLRLYPLNDLSGWFSG